MSWSFYALDYFVGLFESFIFFKLMKYRLPFKSEKNEKVAIFVMSLIIFGKTLLNEAGVSQELMLAGLIATTIGLAHYYFKGSLKVKIATVLIYHIIMVATEIVTISPMLQLPGVTLQKIVEWGNLRIIGSMASKLMAYVVVSAIGRFGKKSRTHVATGELLLEGLALLLLVVGMTLMIYPFVTVNDAMFSFGGQWPAVVGVSFMVIAFTSVWVYEKLFERSQKAYWLRLENEVLSEQTKYYEKVDQMVRHYQSLQHDVNKHMAMVLHYVKEGDLAHLEAYANQWQHSVEDRGEVVVTQSPVLSGLLTHYKSLAKAQQIEMALEVHLDQPLSFADTDLSVAVGNLLENAIAAASKVEQPIIDVKLETKGQYLLMTCMNPHQEKLKKKGELFVSSKREGGQTGLGLINVTRIVEKYDGNLKIEAEGNSFKVTWMMLQPETDTIRKK